MKKKRSNIEQYFHDNPSVGRNSHGTRGFSVALWNLWWKAREPDDKTDHLREGIDEFRRLLERPADEIR